MTINCPKCRSTPSWQCPACGVAYAKAGDCGLSIHSSVTTPGVLVGASDNAIQFFVPDVDPCSCKK